MYLPLKDGTDWEIPPKLLEQIRPLARGVNLDDELAKMQLWLIGNPKKKKTRKGIRKFITGWIAKQIGKPVYVPLPPQNQRCVRCEMQFQHTHNGNRYCEPCYVFVVGQAPPQQEQKTITFKAPCTCKKCYECIMRELGEQ